jgi:UDP-N-acetylmuramoyl-L-alanyl-D-glutamate--2,6-diaminopimelate ligase
MRLKQLVNTLPDRTALPVEDFEVKGVSCNSGSVAGDFLFVAIKGVKDDGHRFIKEAVEKGARAVVSASPYPSAASFPGVSWIITPDTRLALAQLANEFYGRPSEEIKVVGITGTNGKTTVSYLLEAMLKEVGVSPAVIGTINYRFNNKVFNSKNTTPGPLELQSLLSEMAKENVKYAVMEVSSHALDQRRTEGINFHSALFTNVTQDHLDYHGTLEDYFKAKARLFDGLCEKSFAVINNDDPYGRRLREIRAEVLTYGIVTPSDVVAMDLTFDIHKTEFTVETDDHRARFKTRLIGRHNVYNILASVAWGMKEGLRLPAMQAMVEQFQPVPGRLERIEFAGDFAVFVDYAHTDDALRNVLTSLRQVSSGRIITVFGCGGERDRDKRPKMGNAVTELSDFAVITNDNPRSEDPQEIIAEIKRGISKDNYRVIPDRREAIRESLTLAKSGDIVLIAGKGHENYQIFRDRTIHFDDREVARECLRSLKS